MRTSLFCILLTAATHCFGAAPDKIDGFIYYETAKTIARTSYSLAETHFSDGSYSGIYGRATGLPVSDSRLYAPNDGTFTYRKIDDTHAELVLSSSFANGTRTLSFTSDTEGTVSSVAIASANFRLARAADRSPLVNCSNRSFISATTPAFTGFVITGEVSRTVLVRAVGPGLAPFGIADFLRNPSLSVIAASTNRAAGSNDDWSSESGESISRTSIAVGAFPLPTASKDAAAILVLSPGAYIAQVTSPDSNDSGQALIEIYILP
jgi:hypothetical protein